MTAARTVGWTRAAKRSLELLPEKVGTAAIEFIYGTLASNPHRVGKALRFELDGLHAARRGDYRITYRIDNERITVVAVEHRSDAYRQALRLLDHERWLMQFRADAEMLKDEDPSSEIDAW